MARLPSERFLIQQTGGNVILFEEGTEREIVRFNPADANETARAQRTIAFEATLDPQDRAFAHFWSGYFHAHATSGTTVRDAWMSAREADLAAGREPGTPSDG